MSNRRNARGVSFLIKDDSLNWSPVNRLQTCHKKKRTNSKYNMWKSAEVTTKNIHLDTYLVIMTNKIPQTLKYSNPMPKTRSIYCIILILAKTRCF